MKKKKKNSLKGRLKLLKFFSDGIIFIASALSAGKIIRYVESHFSKEKKQNRIAGKLIIAGWIAGILAASYFGLRFLLKYIKKIRGGYLLDLFDRDKFEIADVDNASELENEIRNDLKISDCPVSSEKTVRFSSVPLDEEANENNLG